MKKIPQPTERGRKSGSESVRRPAEASSSADAASGHAGDASASTALPSLEQIEQATSVPETAGSTSCEASQAREKNGRRSGKGRPARKGASKTQARRYARERALQALYQWDMADAESSTVRREFIEHQDMSRVDVAYFERLFKGVSHNVEPVDEALAAALDRPLDGVDPIERAVLRVAAYELSEIAETPARVIINEGVEITKRFGADNGHRYVNGVLDRLAGQLRPNEMKKPS